MAIRFSNVVSRGDWVKIIILLVVAAGCWTWVYREYQKPIIPYEADGAIEVRALR